MPHRIVVSYRVFAALLCLTTSSVAEPAANRPPEAAPSALASSAPAPKEKAEKERAEKSGKKKKGEAPADPPADAVKPAPVPNEQSAEGVVVPPAPALSPEDALKSFKIAPGFRLEIVAAEPLVRDPVAVNFDADGRMWVAEMTSYMPDAYGTGELEPISRIVVLEDTDADGRMDQRTVFLDGLVLPRAVLPVRDGALVAAPPNLWFCRDTDGDGRADEKLDVATDYGKREQNPEHLPNGLTYGLDNWVYSVNYSAAYRYDPASSKWAAARVPSRGQWGLSQDDFGRFFHNTNSDQLRADLVPPRYYPDRNKHHGGTSGVNVRIAPDQSVWPIRPTPAVNRGYRQGQLRNDGTLATFTAACGPAVYRGDILPEDCRGNVFLCEPSAHLVRRNLITEQPDGTVKAINAYDQAEFLASTDERFRPVNLNTGPDGALYVVDMYRGILQHKYFLTPYLRQLHLQRDMDKPTGLGRIYRVVHESAPPRKILKMSGMPTAELVGVLSDPNGWRRDTAQRLIVERQDPSVAPALRRLATTGESPLARLHALWALDGMDGADVQTLTDALRDEHPKIRAAAIRMSEPLLNDSKNTLLLSAILNMVGDAQPDVRAQFAFTVSAVREPAAMNALAGVVRAGAMSGVVRDAALSGLGGRELEFLELLLSDPSAEADAPGLAAALKSLASCVLAEAKPERVVRLLELAAAQAPEALWRQIALLEGVAEAKNPKQAPKEQAAIACDAQPAPLALLAESPEARVRELAHAAAVHFTWPGKSAGEKIAAPAAPLTAEQQARFDEGKILFGATCAACHQPGGEGLEGKAPPLRGSPWVLGSEDRLVRIVLHGVRGPITVHDAVINMEMPGLGVLDDNQIAALLTYARREWEHNAAPVDPATVAKIRKQSEDRKDAWTEKELLQVP